MDIETNKSVLKSWFRALLAGDVERAKSLIDDDCRFYVMGDMPYCGWQNKSDFFAQTQILTLAGPIHFSVGEMTAESDRVFVEAESHALLPDGRTYNNHYVFMVRVRDGKLIEHKEFADTLHIFRVVDSPFITGQSIERQGPLTYVDEELQGAYFGDILRNQKLE